MAFKPGVYRLHAVTYQLIHRTPEVAEQEKQHLIPDFIAAEWIIKTEEEYVRMITDVEHQVNSHYSEKWARHRHAAD